MIALILLGFTSFSQSIKPDRIISEDADTMLCWKIPKAKIIAEELSHSGYCDELILEFEERQDLTDSLLSSERRQKTILLNEKLNLLGVITEKDKDIKLNQELYKIKAGRLKKISAASILISTILTGVIILR